jgi:hypothetical protein
VAQAVGLGDHGRGHRGSRGASVDVDFLGRYSTA